MSEYPSHKRLPEKSYPGCLRILIMSWLFKDPVAITKEIMSCMFKYPIFTVAWLNFDHTHSNRKRPKKFKLPPMRFFLKKQLIKFSRTFWSLSLCKINKKNLSKFRVNRTPYHFCSKMTKLLWKRFSEKPLLKFPCLSWPLSLCKIVKQSSQRIQSCEAGCTTLGLKWPICPKQEVFRISHCCNFHILLAAFIVQNLEPQFFGPKKRVWVICGWANCGSKMVHLPQARIIWKKSILFSSTYWPISLGKIKKKITMDPELWGWVIFGPKMDSFAQTNFFQKACW